MLVLSGNRIVVGVTPSSSGDFLSNPALGFTDKKDYGLRKNPVVQSICIHTRMGVWPQKFVANTKDRKWDTVGVKNASNDDRIASWHISIDSDGSYVSHLDVVKHKAYHCGQCNEVSVGIEMFQDADGTVTNETLDSCVTLVNFLCDRLGIKKQVVNELGILKTFATGKKTGDAKKDLAYLEGGESGVNFSGVFGHRNATRNRGKGDPGDEIFKRLEAFGFTRVKVS